MKFLDVGRQYREWKDEFDEAYHRVMDSGRYVMGEEVEAFEEEWARYCGAKYCIGISSGQDALYLAMLASKVGYGHAVIVPSNTYIATWTAVTQAGGNLLILEPHEDTYNIVPVLKGKLPNNVKVICPVHLYGIPCNMDVIVKFAKDHGLYIVSDCAQAHGATWNKKNVGAFEGLNAWSFYPGKNLGAFGDAGAITTNDGYLANLIRKLRNHGSIKKYDHEVFGVNARMDPLQAAFLRVKLPHLDKLNSRRWEIAKQYFLELKDVPNLILPPSHPEAVWHQFVVRHIRRDDLAKWLDVHGIPTMMHYPIPPHMSGAYKYLNIEPEKFPKARQYASTILSLPIDPFLEDSEVEQVIEAIRKFE